MNPGQFKTMFGWEPWIEQKGGSTRLSLSRPVPHFQEKTVTVIFKDQVLPATSFDLAASIRNRDMISSGEQSDKNFVAPGVRLDM